jgi:hypothetical protein
MCGLEGIDIVIEDGAKCPEQATSSTFVLYLDGWLIFLSPTCYAIHGKILAIINNQLNIREKK